MSAPVNPRETPRPLAYKTLPTVGYLATVIALEGLPYSAWPLHDELKRLLRTDVEACRAKLAEVGFTWTGRPALTLVQGGAR